jgi:glycosyltransferase involved in cell wall biosynthesis
VSRDKSKFEVDMIKVVIATPIPSPYQVELFDAIEARGRVQLLVLYAAGSCPGRRWKRPKIAHDHYFLDEISDRRAADAVLRQDLAIFSGYRSNGFGNLISNRHCTGKPWAFWGERPGFLLPAWLGRPYRKLVFPELHRSRAPIWGIGSWAVEGYRSELGPNRLFLNVSYFSDLDPLLAIDRNEPSGCRIMFSGSFIRRKGIDLLSEAFVDLTKTECDVELHLMGDGSLSEAVRAKTAVVADRVHFYGFRQWNELPFFYAKADVLCAPSRYDGWGMTVPEGLAAGMLVISTDKTGAARELIREDCGWVIPAGDKDALFEAMRQAVQLPAAKRRAMSARARLCVQRQNLEPGVNRFCDAVQISLNHFDS